MLEFEAGFAKFKMGPGFLTCIVPDLYSTESGRLRTNL